MLLAMIPDGVPGQRVPSDAYFPVSAVFHYVGRSYTTTWDTIRDLHPIAGGEERARCLS